MSFKKIFPWFIMAMMTAMTTFTSCSDEDEPDNPNSVTHKVELTTSYSDNGVSIELSPYIDVKDIARYSYNIVESGIYMMVDGKPSTTDMQPLNKWIDNVAVEGSLLSFSFTPSTGENRYAIVDVTLTKDNGNQVIINTTIYQEGKKADEPVPGGDEISYSMRLSIVSSTGEDLLDPATPYNLCGSGIHWSLNNSYPPSGTLAENPRRDEATGMRYVTVSRTFDNETVDREDSYVIYWAMGVNTATITVSEADAEGNRTYTIDGGDPQTLVKDKLITLVTPPAENLHYKPYNVLFQCADIKGNLTDSFYITVTDDEQNKYYPSATAGAPAYSWVMPAGGFVCPFFLTEEEQDVTFSGVRIPSSLSTIYGSEIEFNAKNLFVLGNFDQTRPMYKTFIITLWSKEGDIVKAGYDIRLVNEVRQIANFKMMHFHVYLNGEDMTGEDGSTGIITLKEQTPSA